MNIFTKISLINRVLKLVNALKKHFEKNNIADSVKEKAEKLVIAIKEFGDVIPEFTFEIHTVAEIIKAAFAKKGK